MVKRARKSGSAALSKRAKVRESRRAAEQQSPRSKRAAVHLYEVTVSDPQSVPLGLTIGPLPTGTGGILIRMVDNDGAARRSAPHIAVGDVIVEVNGKDVHSMPFATGRDFIVASARPIALVCRSRNAAPSVSPAPSSTTPAGRSRAAAPLSGGTAQTQRRQLQQQPPQQPTSSVAVGDGARQLQSAVVDSARPTQQRMRSSPRLASSRAPSRAGARAADDEVERLAPRSVLIISPFLGDGGKFRGKSVHGGGVAIRYEQFMLALREDGHSVEVLSPDLDNVDVGVFHAFQHRSFGLTGSTMWRLFHAIRACDVVVATDCVALLPAIAISLLLNKPFAYNIHTDVVTLFSKWPGFAAVIGTLCYQVMLKVTGAFAENVCVARPCTRPRTRVAFAQQGSHSPVHAALGPFLPPVPNLRSFCVSKNQLDQLHSWGVPCHGVYLPIAWTHGAAWSEPVVSRRTDVRRMLAAPLWDEGEPLRTDADRRTLLLFVGRWNEEKRIDILARCIPDSCVLCIVGDGPEPFGSTVERLHDPQGAGIVVRRGFLPREKLVDYYQAADFVVSASNFETFGNMSYEANLCGTRSLLHPSGGHLSQIAVRGRGEGDEGDDDDSTPQHLRFGVNGAYVDFDAALGPETVKIRIDAAVAAVRALPVHKASRGAAGDRDAVRAAIRESITRSGGGLEIGEAVSRTLRSFETHGCVYRAVRRLWTLAIALILIVLVLAPMWAAVWTLV
jgi:glycosyltransferase involved in cell wall biosynthesis